MFKKAKFETMVGDTTDSQGSQQEKNNLHLRDMNLEHHNFEYA
jgi:hypothetical protein